MKAASDCEQPFNKYVQQKEVNKKIEVKVPQGFNNTFVYSSVSLLTEKSFSFSYRN